MRHGTRQLSDKRARHGAWPPATGLVLRRHVAGFYSAVDNYDTRDGTGERDYIHVEDLARAHLAAIEFASISTGCEAINVGTGRGVTVLEMVRAFERASGRAVQYKIGPRRDGDVARSLAAVNKAERLLGWKAKLDIDDMCRTTWNWQSANPNGYVQD